MLGCDLESAARFDRLLTRTRFMQEVYTSGERTHIGASGHPAQTAAGLWCAKEACAKALGVGLFGLLPRELEVVWDGRGAPRMCLHGHAAERFPGCAPELSISHSGDSVMAVVYIPPPDAASGK